MAVFVDKVALKYPNSKDYILKNLSLTIQPNEFVCLLGPSGCGKSSLLGMIAGFVQPNQGKVYHNDEIVKRPSLTRTLVFQEYALFPWLTVIENVAFGLKFIIRDKQERFKVAARYLKMVGLLDHAKDNIFQLSGGMKQRVALARALAPQPDLLLMDEPFGALDDKTRSDMQNQLINICQELRPTVIFVTHSVDEALKLADRIIVIAGAKESKGEIKADIKINIPRPRDLNELNHYRNQVLDVIYGKDDKKQFSFDAMI